MSPTGGGTRSGEAALLREGGAALGIRLNGFQEEALLRYLDLLYVWNPSAGLTTVRRPDSVRLHLLDCLAAADRIGDGPCLDLGSGAGLPGMVLAIVRPEVQFVLVESNRRKASFLMEVARTEKLANVRVVEAPVESLPRDVVYPCVISRAFRPPAEFVAIAASLVAPDGRVILMMADPDDAEIESLAASAGMKLGALKRFHLPGGVEPRTIISLARSGS